jgi:hypothetical protein
MMSCGEVLEVEAVPPGRLSAAHRPVSPSNGDVQVVYAGLVVVRE